MGTHPNISAFARFDRKFFEPDTDFTIIGGGELGGKALGLAAARGILQDFSANSKFANVEIGVPRTIVLATQVFETFMAQNKLYAVAFDDIPDERIAHAFLKADLPATLVGDLRALISQTQIPLAVRSSSLLEDALQHPFAGVYATKMISNNQASIDARFRKLTEAIKLVWASTFFSDAKRYMRSIRHSVEDERMAVVIQEVVGERFDERYYPIISGVVRTHNYYPTHPAKAEDGVVSLALGLGKTIVDGGVAWTYSPRYPNHRPFKSPRDMLKSTQTRFWAVSMRTAPYDPVSESEYLVDIGLDVAEWDDVLRFTASTYDPQADRMILGTGVPGPRVLTFGPILELQDVPLNRLLRRLGANFHDAFDTDVEIEFAVTLDRRNGLPARFGFLQVRPMMVAHHLVDVSAEELRSPGALLASDIVLGNGELDTISDVVYVKPDGFEAKHTPAIAAEVEELNRKLADQDRNFVLIGFGRWGSSDPWLGIPTTWPQISAAKVIVEATLPNMNVDASQGSHFFHNMISFEVKYFTVRHTSDFAIDWTWLSEQVAERETQFLRHVRLATPLRVRVDGRAGRGVILRG